MGWKASAIIIKSDKPVDHLQVLSELGFTKLEEIGEANFLEVVDVRDNSVYIGAANGNTIIATGSLPEQIVEGKNITAEQILSQWFDGAEICTIVLHSAVNYWGYAITKNGKRIRTRAGNGDDGTYLDNGDVLEEEKELLSKATLQNDGRRTYRFGEDDETYNEDQVGENFVFSIATRYFPQPLDCLEEGDIAGKLTGYKPKPIWKIW